MAFTGFFLISFLIVHCGVNACIFLGDHGKTFDAVAHFMGTNWILHFLEVGLFAGLLLHIGQGLYLWSYNRGKRPISYQVWGAGANSSWYSRSMGFLGTLLLLFLVIHLADFWAPNRYGYIVYGKETDLFRRMKLVFSNPLTVGIYLLGLLSLFYHLLHGFQSAFRTFGLNSKKYIPIIKGIGFGFSLLITLVFSLMPVLIYLKVIS